jgi:hypothetical protein
MSIRISMRSLSFSPWPVLMLPMPVMKEASIDEFSSGAA